MPFGNQRLRLLVAAFGGVEQRVRRVPVHHHLAGDHAQVPPFGLCEEGRDADRMRGAVDARRGGAVGRERVEEEARRDVGDLAVAIADFLGEGVFLEPLHQLGAEGGDHLRLRQMQMRVDEAGHHEIGPVVDDRDGRRQPPDQRRRLADFAYDPLVDDDEPVLDEADGRRLARLGRVRIEPEKSPADGEGAARIARGRRHSPDLPASYRPEPEAIHRPSSSRSAGSRPVRLPGGMAWLRTAWRSISEA